MGRAAGRPSGGGRDECKKSWVVRVLERARSSLLTFRFFSPPLSSRHPRPPRPTHPQEGHAVSVCCRRRGCSLSPETLGPLFGFRPLLSPARAPRRLPLLLTMDVPPLRRSVRARNALNPPRIYTLADLDLDCLALVLSLIKRLPESDDRPWRGNLLDCRAWFQAPPLALQSPGGRGCAAVSGVAESVLPR